MDHLLRGVSPRLKKQNGKRGKGFWREGPGLWRERNPRFDSSPVHSGLPPPSLFRLDLVLPVSRFLVVGFTENDSEGGEVGFSKILCRRELQLCLGLQNPSCNYRKPELSPSQFLP